jgi:hypothetical protein
LNIPVNIPVPTQRFSKAPAERRRGGEEQDEEKRIADVLSSIMRTVGA